MFDSYLLEHLKKLRLAKNYYFFAILYGLSTLLIPFSVQLLVNNLSLTGLWVTTASFLFIIAAGLIVSLLVKYSQFLLIEYLQRHILQRELEEWKRGIKDSHFESPYYFEMFKLLKSFAFIFSEGADFVLTFGFGVVALIFIHPAFLVICTLFLVALVIIRALGKGAVKSSVKESDAKYNLFYELPSRNPDSFRSLTLGFFANREIHFGFIKRQALVVFLTYFTVQLVLLGWGIHLIQINELSIGQFVSAEIISSGIFINFLKLPKLLESFYDFETSCYKLEYAKTGGHHGA